MMRYGLLVQPSDICERENSEVKCATPLSLRGVVLSVLLAIRTTRLIALDAILI